MEIKKNLAYIFVQTGGVVALVFSLMLFFYFVFTGELFPIGLQGEPIEGLGAVFFFVYIFIDIFFILKGAKLMRKEETFKQGSEMALFAGILGINWISIVGGIMGIFRKN